MVRKVRDLLSTGLTSELYLLAFLEPNNIRQLAQKLQNTTGNPTNYGKANPAIHDLTTAKYLKQKNDGKFYANIPKLADEINEILKTKEENLTNDEIKLLQKFLQHREFFKFISQDIIHKMKNQPKGKHKINALQVFCERIGGMASMAIVNRTVNPKVAEMIEGAKNMSHDELEEGLTNFDSKWNEIIADIESNFEHAPELENLPHKEKLLPIVLGIFKSIPAGAILFVAPEIFLKKLSKLWNGHEGVSLTLELFSTLNKT